MIMMIMMMIDDDDIRMCVIARLCECERVFYACVCACFCVGIYIDIFICISVCMCMCVCFFSFLTLTRSLNNESLKSQSNFRVKFLRTSYNEYKHSASKKIIW